MLMACLKHLPIKDLVNLMSVSKPLRQVSALEITAQVHVLLKTWMNNAQGFLDVLKVRK